MNKLDKYRYDNFSWLPQGDREYNVSKVREHLGELVNCLSDKQLTKAWIDFSHEVVGVSWLSVTNHSITEFVKWSSLE